MYEVLRFMDTGLRSGITQIKKNLEISKVISGRWQKIQVFREQISRRLILMNWFCRQDLLETKGPQRQ